MESQIKQLKINSTNIKNTLFKSNKELKKLRAKERNLLNRQKISAKRLQKENFTEGKGSGAGGGMGGYLAGKALAPTMSIIDKLKEFAGTVLLGLLVNNLPTAIKKVEKFLEENKDIIKTVKDVITATGNALLTIVNIFKGPNAPNLKELQEENKELQKLAKEFEKGGEFGKQIDALTKESDGLEDDFRKEFKEQYTDRTPEQSREDVATALPGSGLTLNRLDFQIRTFKMLQGAVKGNNLSRIGYEANTGEVYTIPGIGSYTIETDKAFGIPFGNPYLVTRDAYGTKISQDKFAERVTAISGKTGDYSELLETLSSMGEDNELAKTKGYSQGGFVNENGPSKPLNTVKQGQSAEEKIAVRKASTFADLKDSVLKESKIFTIKEKSQQEVKNLIEDLKKYLEFTKPERTPSSPYTVSPGQSGPTISTPPGLPGLKVEPDEVIGTVGYTGYTEPEGIEGSHIHIENMDNYENGIPQGVKYSILVNGVPMPQKLKRTSGIGWRWGKMHKGEDFAGDPDQPITLTGGLKFKQFIPDRGDGYGNRVLIEDPDGVVYSLNHLNAGPTNINELVKKQQKQGQGSVAPVKKPGYGKGGSAMAMDLTQTFDDGGSEVVMIMTQQPIVVPGPTRYITRTVTQTMPVPVAIHPKSSGLRSLV